MRDRLKPLDSGKTGADGTLTFPNRQKALLPGLYLVYGKPFSTGKYNYTTEPFLVQLPVTDMASNTWQYDLTVTPKHTREDVPETPSQTVTRKVLKVWDDSGHASGRPESITVQLLKTGRSMTPYLDTLVILGHNYPAHFKELKSLHLGDAVQFTDADGNVFSYTVSDFEQLRPDQVTDMISGDWDLTLFTCTVGGQLRLAVRCVREEAAPAIS